MRRGRSTNNAECWWNRLRVVVVSRLQRDLSGLRLAGTSPFGDTLVVL